MIREREERRSWGNSESLLAGIHDALQVLLSLYIAQATGGKQQPKPQFARRPGDAKTDDKPRVTGRQLAMMMKGH